MLYFFDSLFNPKYLELTLSKMIPVYIIKLNYIYIPKSLNTNISHQLFDYITTIVKSHHQKISKFNW